MVRILFFESKVRYSWEPQKPTNEKKKFRDKQTLLLNSPQSKSQITKKAFVLLQKFESKVRYTYERLGT